jgi:uncharacterized membrane protein YphA (DoxX/SURF4 family)
MKFWLQGIRVFFILLLAASAAGKLADMSGFATIVESYRVLARWLVPVAAWALAITELVIALWLISGWRLREAAAALIALHAIYLLWLLSALLRGLNIENCGCFGVYFARPLTWFTPLEDMVLLSLSLLLWRGTKRGARR